MYPLLAERLVWSVLADVRRQRRFTDDSYRYRSGRGRYQALRPCWASRRRQVLAVDEGHTLARMVGLAQRKPPLRIRTDNGQLFVGAGADEWGRPLSEDLDHDRFTGSPGCATPAAGFTGYAQTYESLQTPWPSTWLTAGGAQRGGRAVADGVAALAGGRGRLAGRRPTTQRHG